MRRAAAPQNKNHSISIYKKTVNRKISQKVPFGRWKGPLQISKWHCIKIVEPSCHKSTIYVSPPKWPITRMAIAGRPDPKKKKKKMLRNFTCCYTSMPIYGSKFWNLGCQKNLTTFWHLKNPKKSALFGPANSQLVTYSKIQPRVCRVPWGTPMDWFKSWSNQSMPSTL